MPTAPFRRIVTGHDAQGNAIIQEDGPPPRVQRIGGEIGPMFYEVWNTRETPARIDRAWASRPRTASSSRRRRTARASASSTSRPKIRGWRR